MEEFRKLLKITKRLLIIERYESFEDKSEKSIRKGKRNFQGTLHPNIFQILQKYLEVNMEIYASPLYCYFDTCCSAFYDTDQYFLLEGSFECAPPNSEHVLLQAAKHITEIIINRKKGPLSFIVFFPNWNDLEAIQWLEKNQHHFAFYIKKVIKLRYMDRQSNLPEHSEREVKSGDSMVYIIQNKTGKLKWEQNAFNVLEIFKNMEHTAISSLSFSSFHKKRNFFLT